MTTPSLLAVLSLEISIIVPGIASFFLSDKLKRITRITALGILLSLIAFFLVFWPLTPVNMSPNHPDNDWNSGSVVHVLPTVNDNRIRIKVSYEKPMQAPKLNVNGKRYAGKKMDTYGKFWRFDAKNLTPNTTYQLVLENATGGKLCDPWPLSTFPSPQAKPDNLRVLAFTGSGGNDTCTTWFGAREIPLSIRKKLLNEALSHNPDILVGTGDQIYYDIKHGKYDLSAKIRGGSRRSIYHNGKFDPSKPVWGTKNENVLKRAVGPQIAYLYGTACRSTPSFFIMDDHDYFTNDGKPKKEDSYAWSHLLILGKNPYLPKGTSFPLENFNLRLGRAAQKLYLPEFLPSPYRPDNLPSMDASEKEGGVSESFGTLRYGKLVEGLFYDVRRFMTLTERNNHFIPPEAENWVINRMRAEDSKYVINFSPISFGWSAGKWFSWYPDVVAQENGKNVLTTEKKKYLWQEGWFDQHNRILKAASNMENSTPLFVCGDMHAQAAGEILESGNLDFSSDPIPSVLTGSMSATRLGFPSNVPFTGIKAQPPADLKVQENLPSFEKAGFIIMDITPEEITIRFYAWRYGENPIKKIDDLNPHHIFEIKSTK